MPTPNSYALGPVSGPKPIVDAISTLGPNFRPDLARKEYEDNIGLWKMYLDFLELDANKLAGMLDRHGATVQAPEGSEAEAKFGMRKKMAVVFNLIPSMVSMLVGYLHAEEPIISDGDDAHLKAFLADCDGNGMPLKEWIRLKGLPMSIALGWVDVMVQNPPGTDAISNEADAVTAKPTIFPITPLARINWSANPNDEYNWVTFKDRGNENDNPLLRNSPETWAYITLSKANADVGGRDAKGFWIRSWVGPDSRQLGKPIAERANVWFHDSGYTPVNRCAVAPLYFRKSIDPERRHWGVSKIAMMAVLTRCILNVLSWTQEDILANLAILALPSKGGRAPKDEQGNPIVPNLTPFTILWTDTEAGAGAAAKVIQGNVSHIEFKMDFVAALVNEILRIGNMMGVSGEQSQVTSGVMGLVERNELFQELGQLAEGLDTFGYEVLALAKSWATGEEWTVERLRKEIPNATINFHKGPYTLDPLKDVLANAQSVMAMMRPISPTMQKAAAKYVARAFLYANDPDLDMVIDEIKKATQADFELMLTPPAPAAPGGGTAAGGGQAPQRPRLAFGENAA